MAKAIKCYEQTLEISRELGDQRSEGIALGNIGNKHLARGEKRKAIEFHKQALAISCRIGDRRSEATQLSNLGDDFRHRDHARAKALYTESLAIFEAIQSHHATRVRQALADLEAQHPDE